MADWQKLIRSGSNAELNQVTASFFKGDGSGLTGVISSSYALTASYALNSDGGGPSISASYAETASYLNNQARYFAYHNQAIQDVTWSFQHNLGNQFPVVTVWNTDNEVVIPEKIYAPTTNLTYIYFPTSQSGFVAATIGSILPTGSYGDFSGSFSGSFRGDGSGLTGIVPTLPANLISSSQQVDFTGIINKPIIVSASQQISSDISGSFISASNSLSSRISTFESKTLFSGSSQVSFTGLINVPAGILSSSNGFISSSQQIASDISGSSNIRFNAIEVKTGSYATTGSNIFKSDQILSGSFTISGSIFVSSGSISGSHKGDGSGLTGIITSSYAATSSFNTTIFSRGTTYFVSGGMNTTPEDFTIWKSPYSCRVIALQGWADGTGSFINARKSGSSGYSSHTSSLQITNKSTWISSNSVLNTDYAQNDTLQIMITGSTNTSRITIQLDFIRI